MVPWCFYLFTFTIIFLCLFLEVIIINYNQINFLSYYDYYYLLIPTFYFCVYSRDRIFYIFKNINTQGGEVMLPQIRLGQLKVFKKLEAQLVIEWTTMRLS